MPLSFPSSPANGQTSVQNGRTYQWDGYAWSFVSPGGSGVTDGSKGDIVVSNGGATWAIAAGAVVTADIADGAVTLAKTTGIQKSITSGSAPPSGGSDGDIYLQYT